MLTLRQEKILNFLVKEYIATSEPVGSLALKKVCDLDVSGATIRNDLQELAKQGYIEQPHTSAGRIPTKKAYKHFADCIRRQSEMEFEMFIVRQIKSAHEQMEQEMRMMERLMDTLENDNIFEILTILESWHKKTMN
jgi:heat-inducible transcriptional repressor